MIRYYTSHREQSLRKMSLSWVLPLSFPRIRISGIRNMQTNEPAAFSPRIAPSQKLNSHGERSPLNSNVDVVHKQPRLSNSLKVAVAGCAHGELDSLYRAVAEVERKESCKIDLIICPGDFQAVRNETDLQYMACPPKYRDMRSFWKYYAGQSVALTPTIFVGGNHEAPSHLQEMPLGGLVAPNMYYLGNAGVINFRGLRIGGISGVYSWHGYHKKRLEKPPYERGFIRSVYQTRREDVDRLRRIGRPLDIFISHDWPRGVTEFGNLDKLLMAKPFLATEISNDTFGNPGTMELLRQLQPSFWFAAHMHVKFAALFQHSNTGKQTKFLALDKVLPKRDFLQILDFPLPDTSGSNHQGLESPINTEIETKPVATDVVDAERGNSNEIVESTGLVESTEPRIELDHEWLTILRTHASDPSRSSPPSNEEIMETVELLQADKVRAYVLLTSDFERRAPSYKAKNKQTLECEKVTLQPRNMELYSTLKCPLPDYIDQVQVSE